MSRPRLLDLFCGAGGAAWGYHLAGFEVVGVDLHPQPRYPFQFVQADALAFLRQCIALGTIRAFDLVHASPPCQAYTTGGRAAKDGRHPRLIEPVRELLDEAGVTYVIENVPESPLRRDAVLCGSMFGLGVRRHRIFESNAPLGSTPLCDHEGQGPIVGVYGHPHGKAGAWPGMRPSTLETWSEAMGIDWMTAAELAEAIPPAYTAHLGRQLLAHLGEAAA